MSDRRLLQLTALGSLAALLVGTWGYWDGYHGRFTVLHLFFGREG